MASKDEALQAVLAALAGNVPQGPAVDNPNLPRIGFTPATEPEYIKALNLGLDILNDPRNTFIGAPGAIAGFIPKMWRQGIKAMTPVKGVVPTNPDIANPVSGHPAFTAIGHNRTYEPTNAIGYNPNHPVYEMGPTGRGGLGTDAESTGLALQRIADSEGGYKAVRDMVRNFGGSTEAAQGLTDALIHKNYVEAGRVWNNSRELAETLKKEGLPTPPKTLTEIDENNKWWKQAYEEDLPKLDPSSEAYRLLSSKLRDIESDQHPFLGGPGILDALRRSVERFALPGFGEEATKSQWPKPSTYAQQYPGDAKAHKQRVFDYAMERAQRRGDIASTEPGYEPQAVTRARERRLREEVTTPRPRPDTYIGDFEHMSANQFMDRFMLNPAQYESLQRTYNQIAESTGGVHELGEQDFIDAINALQQTNRRTR